MAVWFQKWLRNSFEDNNEKSCSWLKNKVTKKIVVRADGTHESHPIAWELKLHFMLLMTNLPFYLAKKICVKIS